MNKNKKLTSLQQLLRCIGETAQADKVSIKSIMDHVGHRSFGSLLLVAGLLTLAPIIGDIPGVPTLIGMFVLLIAGQLLMGQHYFWLPKWLLNRAITAEKLTKALDWLDKPAAIIDKFIKPRLLLFVSGFAKYMIAIMCVVIALCMPIMEVVPFSANLAGIALAAFGLSLIAEDGVLALFSFILTFTSYVLLAINFF